MITLDTIEPLDPDTSLPAIVDHRDGFWLNDAIEIVRDAPDAAKGGNASHRYEIARLTPGETGTIPETRQVVGTLQFQQGPRDLPESIDGLTDAALVAVLLDRYRGFQSGLFACRDNAVVITKLEEALMWMQKRARDRAARGVLGTLKK